MKRPPRSLVKETRLTIWLIVSLLLFDSFPQYSIEKNIKYWGKLSEKKRNCGKLKAFLAKNTIISKKIALTSDVQLMKYPLPMDFGPAHEAINCWREGDKCTDADFEIRAGWHHEKTAGCVPGKQRIQCRGPPFLQIFQISE